MAIDPKNAFIHLIYDYRYLAAAGCAWKTVGPDASPHSQKSVNAVIPEIGVLVQDSLLVHARSLIDFFTKTNARHDDIILSNFNNLSVSSATQAKLIAYKKPIERHALHLTHSRDVHYRTTNPAIATNRIDWNVENSKLVLLLIDALKEASSQHSSWQKPLTDLHTASVKRLNDANFAWPNYLAEANDVNSFLVSNGL